MKKFIASIAALTVCALMLTACGDKTDTGDEGLTESITAAETAENKAEAKAETKPKAETKAEKKTETKAETEKETETETETEAETEAETNASAAAASYSSMDEFIKDKSVFDLPGKLIPSKDTNTYTLMKDFEGGSGIHMAFESTDGTMNISMSMEGDNIAVNMIVPNDTSPVWSVDSFSNVSLIVTNGIMYILDPVTKSGYSMALSDDLLDQMFGQYDLREILSDLDVDAKAENDRTYSCNVEIGGKPYTFEYADKMGMLYDASGKLCTIVSGDKNSDVPDIIINEFSSNIPSGAFKVPSGYEIYDMTEMADLFG
ncbi:MAG: hypothetical protein J1F11_01750 [Oscillospiraceae bacterium]|nr:hypothetical protein [Oscillospiraceae bacterium]